MYEDNFQTSPRPNYLSFLNPIKKKVSVTINKIISMNKTNVQKFGFSLTDSDVNNMSDKALVNRSIYFMFVASLFSKIYLKALIQRSLKKCPSF